MDKFNNYNEYNEDNGYAVPNYDGYQQANNYDNPEFTGYTGGETYAPSGLDGYGNETTYTLVSEYEDYNENETYTTPNYDGVRLMDVTYNDSVPQEPLSSDTHNELEDSLFAPLYPEEYVPVNESVHMTQPEPEKITQTELTEAELADIRRQKVAARRKKQAVRERRRKERRKQAIIRCSILLAIILLLIIGLVMLISGIWKHFEEKKKNRELSEYYATSEVTTEEPVAKIDDAIIARDIPADRDAALLILRKQAENDSTIQSICDSAAAMPDILLQNLAVNSELKEFTLSYPAKINIVFDGDFELEVEENDIPLYLQFDERWGYADYSTDIIALRGAGPTALSMAYTYLKADGSQNPIRIADYATEKGYLDENGKTHWSLMTTGAETLGLKSTEMTVDKDAMIKALEDDKVLICKMLKGDFTTDESFIVIRDYKDGFFYVNDPNSKARSEVGWDFKRLRSQIEKICALEADQKTTTPDADTTQAPDSDKQSTPSAE